MVGGLDRVYEINRNFRNEGVSTQHNPEFTMLEFYQAYANYHDLMQITEELIEFVAREVNGTTVTEFNGHTIDLAKWRRLTMREAIREFWPEEAGAKPAMTAFESAPRCCRHALHAAVEFARRRLPGRRHGSLRSDLAELKTIHGAVTARLLRLDEGRADRQVGLQPVRGGGRALPHPAHHHLRLPGRGFAALQGQARRPGPRRALRVLCRRL